ncbi:hypothetical protein XU18_0495 [Perkinsela sp. CCAP 1560/4]|nr:hypothetical protein XU18_0495 [Perkinsela sp. CCAP 1560/4]|eukprot:KNH09217.1 hypothetical protein XU18_0495 [Perkinsela sp. CCAP 1560/4]
MVYRLPLVHYCHYTQLLGQAFPKLRDACGGQLRSLNRRTFTKAGVIRGSDSNDSDYFELSSKLEIADFESGKFLEETENETGFDYMSDNDDHYFGKWDPRPKSSAENDIIADGINIQIPSPKRTSKNAGIGAILQESLNTEGDISHASVHSPEDSEPNDFKIEKTFRENVMFESENANINANENYAPEEPTHGHDNLEHDENQTEELLAEADDLLHTTELEIEESETNITQEKSLASSWLENNIMGNEPPKAFTDSHTATEKRPRGLMNDKNRFWNQCESFPWSTDDFSGSAGRGKPRQI